MSDWHLGEMADLQTRVLDRAIPAVRRHGALQRHAAVCSLGQGWSSPQNRCKVLYQSGVRRETRLAVGRDDDANSGSRVDDVSFHSVASLYGAPFRMESWIVTCSAIVISTMDSRGALGRRRVTTMLSRMCSDTNPTILAI